MDCNGRDPATVPVSFTQGPLQTAPVRLLDGSQRRTLRSLRLTALTLLVGLVASGCAGDLGGSTRTTGSEEPARTSVAQYPTGCPAGFAKALASALRNTKSASNVKPSSLGLGKLEPDIACAVRTRSTDRWLDNQSFYTVVVMKPGVAESDVTSALTGLGFENRLGWGRDAAAPGQTSGALVMTFGEMSRNLRDNSPRWAEFQAAFPPETVVLNATVRRSKPAPRWVCRYSPTYNEDWHDDVLCTNGRETERPYLRPFDAFITKDEIMQAARKYENQLNIGL